MYVGVVAILHDVLQFTRRHGSMGAVRFTRAACKYAARSQLALRPCSHSDDVHPVSVHLRHYQNYEH